MRYRFLKGSWLQFPDRQVKFAAAVHPPGTATVWEINHYAIEITMSKRNEKGSVVGCKDQHKTLPAAADKRVAWIEFIYGGLCPCWQKTVDVCEPL